MAVILECPVCGKSPKIKARDRFGEPTFVTVICKSLFGTVHEEALAYDSCATFAYRDAINLWNARVKTYKEVHNNANPNN